MADKVGTAVLELKLDNNQYKRGLADTSKASKKAADSLRGISQAVNVAIFAQLGKVAIKAITGIATAIADLGTKGAGIDDVSQAFSILSEKAGSSADVMLGELREGVRGTISDAELMAGANKALGAGLIKSAEDMGVLASGARQLAKATGGDTKEAFEKMLGAIASGRTASLKQIGLFVDSKQAIEEYGFATGKTVAEINDADRAIALSNATLAALRERLKEIPPQARDFGEMIESAKVAVTNFHDEVAVGVATSGVFASGFVAAGDALTAAFGPQQGELVNAVVEIIEEVAIQGVNMGIVMLNAGKGIVVLWAGLKVLFNSVVSSLVLLMGGLIGQVAAFVEVAAMLPGVGVQFAGVASSARALATDITYLGLGFRKNALDATASGIAQVEALDKVEGGLVAAKDAMRAAQSQTVETAEVTKTAMSAMGTAAEQMSIKEMLASNKAATSFETDERRKLEAAAKTVVDIAAKKLSLENQLALMQTEGVEKRRLELEQARAAELLGLAGLKDGYALEYAALAELVNEKYDGMRAKAEETFAETTKAVNLFGLSTRDELEETARAAVAAFEAMRASGEYNIEALKDAQLAAEEAKRAAGLESKDHSIDMAELISSGSLTIFQLLGKKFKAAAIAGALIATYQAVAKALASAPWPFNIPLAAGALAAGMMNVNRIRNAEEGWREGTPDLDFANFGRVSMQPLHGSEAVIPKGGGHALAGEIATSLPVARDVLPDSSRDSALLTRIAESLEGQPLAMKRALRQALQASPA